MAEEEEEDPWEGGGHMNHHDHEVEVSLLLASGAPSSSSPAGGGASAGEERVLTVAHMERDPTKRERKVRASTGPQAGRRVWLRVPRGHPPMTVPAPSPSGGAGEELLQLQLRIRVGGLSLQAKISPPLPASCRPDDPPLERQFGSLRANGVAVQLRFAPFRVATADAEGGDSEESRGADANRAGGSSGQPQGQGQPPRYCYRLLDGAFTADDLATDGQAALAAAGAVVARTARDAIALPAPAPRAGRTPEIWEPQRIDKDSDFYDPKEPNKLAYDSRAGQPHT